MRITKCPSCGTIISEGLDMCPRCGVQLGADALKHNAAPATAIGEDKIEKKKNGKEPKKKKREIKLSTKVLLTSLLLVLISVIFKVLAFVFAAKNPAANPGSLWLEIDFFFSVFLVFALLPIPFLIKGWWKKLVGLILVAGLGALWVLHCIHLYNGILWTVNLF